MEDPYTTLGVPRDADADTIKRAHRQRARATHPDRAGGDEEAFKTLAAAYALLSDPGARDHYDRTGRAPEPTPATTPAENIILSTLHNAVIAAGDLSDVLGALRKAITGELDRKREHLLAAVETANVAAAQLGRFQLRQDDRMGDNLIEGAFTRLNENAQRARIDLANAIDAHEEALDLLDLYSDLRPAEPKPVYYSRVDWSREAPTFGRKGRGATWDF